MRTADEQLVSASAVSRAPGTNLASATRRVPPGPAITHLGAEHREAARASRPPGRRGRGCRRSCRGCAPRDRRCRARPARRKPPVGSGTRPSSIAACVTQAPMRDRVRVFADGRQLGDARDVDEQRRLRQAQVEHRAERLAAGQHLGRPVAGEQLAAPRRRPSAARSRRRRASCGCRLHSRAAIASTMRRGVIGDSVISTPRRRSASLTALAIAAGGAIAPPSPMPFWPNRV